MKLKLKKENKKTLSNIKKKNPLEIYTGIIEDVNKINEIKFFIEELTSELSSGNFDLCQDNFNHILKIFDHYLIKNKSVITESLKCFLLEKVKMLKNIFMDSIDLEDAETKIILKYLYKMFRYNENNTQKNEKNNDKNKNKFNNEVNKELVYKLLLTEDQCDGEIILYFIKLLLTSSSLISNFLIILKDELSKEENKIEKQNTFYNIYNFIISIPVIEDSIKEVNDLEDISNFKLAYQSIIISLVNNNYFPVDLMKRLMKSLNKVVFENLENPLIFSDYLINIYERSNEQDFDVKVLSLSGLFVLLTKYKLDYSLYYQKLYETISLEYYDQSKIRTVFDSFYRKRIIKIIELSLKSPNVPVVVTLSFIKKLIRVALKSETSTVLLIISIIFNIMQKHPKSLNLLARKRKKTTTNTNSCFVNNKEHNENKEEELNKDNNLKQLDEKDNDNDKSFNDNDSTNENNDDVLHFAKYEKFNDEELDPYKTNSKTSCLWELYTLKNHYSNKVRQFLKKFEKNFLDSKEVDIDSVIDVKEKDLLYELTETTKFNINYDHYFKEKDDNDENDVKSRSELFRNVKNLIS